MDEDFSRATHMAVVQFKMDRGLPGDGILDAAAWAALEQGAQMQASRGLDPGRPRRDDEAERSRRRGRKIEGWGRLLFVAAAAVVAVRLVLDRGIMMPRRAGSGPCSASSSCGRRLHRADDHRRRHGA